MAALTADVIVDRVRSVCAGSPFWLQEAVTWASFDLQPSQNLDGVFRIPPPVSDGVIGGFQFAEDRTDLLEIWVARRHNQDFATARQTLLRDVHSLTAAIVRDASVASGDYAVPDGGRAHSIEAPGTDYLTLRLTLPVNYEAQL